MNVIAVVLKWLLSLSNKAALGLHPHHSYPKTYQPLNALLVICHAQAKYFHSQLGSALNEYVLNMLHHYTYHFNNFYLQILIIESGFVLFNMCSFFCIISIKCLMLCKYILIPFLFSLIIIKYKKCLNQVIFLGKLYVRETFFVS